MSFQFKKLEDSSIDKSLKKFSQRLKIESIFIFINDLLQLWVWVKINDHAAWLFIDSDCTKNYIFSEFASKAQIFMQKKKEFYNLQNFNETLMKYNNELIDQEIQFIHLRFKHHWKKLRLNVMKCYKRIKTEQDWSFNQFAVNASEFSA